MGKTPSYRDGLDRDPLWMRAAGERRKVRDAEAGK
jgi:hypothetical protein